ncbi:MAG: class I tRNA ligase family protein, partial [Pseudomonadota bacterium]
REGRKVEYIPPEDVVRQQGAELLRLWVASSDFRTDITYSRTILNQLSESYRKYRNTSRFVLGNLYDYNPAKDRVGDAELRDLDRYALALLRDFCYRVTQAYEQYELHTVFRSLIDFVTVELSAFYFDVVKDRLYCDSPASSSRRAVQTTLCEIGRALATLSAPILSFTAEDIWRHLPRAASDPASVHLAAMPAGAPLDANSELVKRWAILAEYRKGAVKALEPFRAAKHHPLDALLVVMPNPAHREILKSSQEALPELCGVSSVVISPDNALGEGPAFTAEQAPGRRCDRCWKYTSASGALCDRCATVLGAADA